MRHKEFRLLKKRIGIGFNFFDGFHYLKYYLKVSQSEADLYHIPDDAEKGWTLSHHTITQIPKEDFTHYKLQDIEYIHGNGKIILIFTHESTGKKVTLDHLKSFDTGVWYAWIDTYDLNNPENIINKAYCTAYLITRPEPVGVSIDF